MKRLSAAQKRENIAVAYSIIGGIPAKHFDLDSFCSTSSATTAEDIVKSCGSTGCTLGWLATHPHFVSQGIRLHQGEVIRDGDQDKYYYQKVNVVYIADALFGRRAFKRFFEPYGGGSADSALCKELGLPYDHEYCDHDATKEQQKTLALARLKRGYYSKFNSKLEVPK
jgi:hypothetical protein